MIESLARLKFTQLEQWLSSQQSNGATIGTIEGSLESDGRELLRLLLQEHINRRCTVDFGNAIAFWDRQGIPRHYAHKRIDSRIVITTVGQIKIARTGYYSHKIGALHPIDELLQLPRRCYSYEVQRRTVKMAVLGPFDEALEIVRESMGIILPKRSAEEILVDAAVDFDDFYSTRNVDQNTLCDPIIVAAVDCKGIPMVKSELIDANGKVRRGKGEKAQKKKMATVAAVFTQQPYIRTPQDVVDSLFRPEHEPKHHAHKSRCNNKRIWASLTSGKDIFIADVVKEVSRRNQRQDKFLVVVTDGERALQQKISRTMKGATLILDLIHALEKVWKAAYVFHEEGSLDAQLFVKTRTLAILNGKVGQVVKGFRSMVTKNKLSGNKRDVLAGVSNYLYRNRSRMKYHIYLQQGLPIASGSVEGACKNLIKDRMERSGMRWTQRSAEAMVKMRAAYLSGDFDEYWIFHIAQEQNRLYTVKWNTVHAK
jgi:hypothetical protein